MPFFIGEHLKGVKLRATLQSSGVTSADSEVKGLCCSQEPGPTGPQLCDKCNFEPLLRIATEEKQQ